MTSLSKHLSLCALGLGFAACGGAEPRAEVPYEEAEDVSVVREERTVATGRAPVGRNFVGSRWQWIEATCTEGTTDLAAKGFTDELRVEREGESSYLLVHDEGFGDGCKRTVLQSAAPLEAENEFRLTEELLVGLPATDACARRPDTARTGEVRMHGDFLEVLVRRSPLCNGFEVRHVYGPAPVATLTGEQIARRYVAHYNRRDVARIATLFSDAGSLVESFTVNEDNTPTRHDGREAVRAWYTQSLADVPWVALRLTALAPTDQQGQIGIDWEYMDPRLSTPFTGRNLLTIAAGEIFEAQFDVAAPAGAQTTTTTPSTQAATGAATTPAEEGRPARPARGGRAAGRRR